MAGILYLFKPFWPHHSSFGHTHLIFNSAHLLFNSTHLLLNSTHLLYNSSHLLFNSYHLLFNSTHLLFNSTHLLFNSSHLLFDSTHFVFDRIHTLTCYLPQVDPNDSDSFPRIVEMWFIFCVVWSICAPFDEDGRKKIDNYMREVEGAFPNKDSIYEYIVEPKLRTWQHWEERLRVGWRFTPG